ncbi:MAG: TIM barrel protein [Geodermatophilaceae bacterium]
MRYGVTFHDDDLVPFGSGPDARAACIARFTAALAQTGLTVPMMTTNLFTHPVFKDGGLPQQPRRPQVHALRKVMRNLDLAAELGAATYVFWGGREGTEIDAAKDVRVALDRYREALDTLAAVRRGARVPAALRVGAQAQRAARRHLPPDDRARARVHLPAGPAGVVRRESRGRT